MRAAKISCPYLEGYEEAGADLFLLTKLEDIAWLLNIRGGDIHTVPVVLAYLMMSEQEVRLYANEADFSEGLKEMLAKAGVALYHTIRCIQTRQRLSPKRRCLSIRARPIIGW